MGIRSIHTRELESPQLVAAQLVASTHAGTSPGERGFHQVTGQPQARMMLPLPVLAWLARLLEREGGREDGRDGDFSNSATVYRTPANGENIVLTHMSNRVYATLAYLLTVAESTLVMLLSVYCAASFALRKTSSSFPTVRLNIEFEVSATAARIYTRATSRDVASAPAGCAFARIIPTNNAAQYVIIPHTLRTQARGKPNFDVHVRVSIHRTSGASCTQQYNYIPF